MKNIAEIFIAIACAWGVLLLIFRSIWLFFPSFLKGSRLYKLKDPAKGEILLYYLAAMLCMTYFIVKFVEKL